MTRKTRAQRREGGGYDFSFGARSKKLLAVAEKVGGKWLITDGFAFGLTDSYKKLSDLKGAWGEFAAASYGQSSPPPALGGPPSIRKGPPRLKPKALVYDGPTCPDCRRPITGWFDDLPPCRCNAANDVGYIPDPFDRSMFDSVGKGVVVSAYGALDMVYHWMLRNPDYIQTKYVMASPWREVQEVLWRTRKYAEYRPDQFAALAEPRESAGEAAGEPAGDPAAE